MPSLPNQRPAIAHKMLELQRSDKPMELAIGQVLWETWLGPVALEYPIGFDLRDAATKWLYDQGFSDVGWSMPDDHTLLLFLGFHDFFKVHKQFLLEFTGDRSEIISVFQFAGEVVME